MIRASPWISRIAVGVDSAIAKGMRATGEHAIIVFP